MKLLVFFLPLLFLLSCKKPFYHVASVQSQQVKVVGKDFVFENQHLKLIYNLWEPGGRMRFLLFNKTDQSIYLDWSKSFFVRNENKVFYTQLPAPAKRAYKDTVRYVYQDKPVEPYRLSVRDNPVLDIPPLTYVAIADFPLQQIVQNAKTKEKDFIYSIETTPLRFGQQLTYSLDKSLGNPQQIEQFFWVNKIQVLKSGELVRQFGSGKKGHPNALYNVENREAKGSVIYITVGTFGVCFLIARQLVTHMFDGFVLNW